MPFDDAVCLAGDGGGEPGPRRSPRRPRRWEGRAPAGPPEAAAPPMHPLRASLLFPIAGESRGTVLRN